MLVSEMRCSAQSLRRASAGRRLHSVRAAAAPMATVPAVVVGAGRVGSALVQLGALQGVTDVVRLLAPQPLPRPHQPLRAAARAPRRVGARGACWPNPGRHSQRLASIGCRRHARAPPQGPGVHAERHAGALAGAGGAGGRDAAVGCARRSGATTRQACFRVTLPYAVYFAVAKLGELPTDGRTDLEPEGLTAVRPLPCAQRRLALTGALALFPPQVHGPWAEAVATRLYKAGLACRVLDKAVRRISQPFTFFSVLTPPSLRHSARACSRS